MEFSVHGTNYQLVGTSTSTTLASPASEASARRALTHLSSLTTADQPPSPTPEHIQALINQYPELFQPPSSLPPHRDVDHRIPLLSGTGPINVRPYRYGHAQKAELERQVEKMLSAGLISPSMSPFSSPALLVAKGDSFWRFCVDY